MLFMLYNCCVGDKKMNNTFIYKENGITEYISLDKPTIERINGKPYVENLIKNVPTESLKNFFNMLVGLKADTPAVSTGNINEYQTDLGKQKFFHLYVDIIDRFGDKKTLNFLLSNYELLQYEEVNARNGSVVLTDEKDCLLNKEEIFQTLSLLYANQHDYKKDWATYHLAKECYLNKNSYNQNLRKDIIDFKKASPAQINLGESVINQLDAQLEK